MAEEQRSLALGVQSVLWRGLGSIPGPILFGVVFDASCLYFQTNCGRRGNCWVYNNNQISTRAFFVSVTGVIVNFVFMLLCWIFYPPVTCKNRSSEDSQEGKVKVHNNCSQSAEKGHVDNPLPEKNPADLY